MGLATLAEIKTALNITDTDSDDQIDALIEPMSALVEMEAGRSFSPQEHVERHPGGEPTIALRQRPVSTGSPAIQVVDKATGEALAATEYDLDATLGLLRRLPLGAQWESASARGIVYLREVQKVHRWEVTYTAGEVPQNIKLALYLAVGANLDRSATTSGGGGAIGGIVAEKDGDYSYQRAASAATSANSASLSASGLPAPAAAIARSYRAGAFV